MIEKTLVIIKPDALERDLAGEILSRFEKAGLHIGGLKMVSLTKAQAQKFYAEHRGKPFFDQVTNLMSSARVIAVVLCGRNAITRVRSIMGSTNPTDAPEGTIRHDFGLDRMQNSVHGSDCPEAAAREITFFFNRLELTEHPDKYYGPDTPNERV